MTDEIETPDGSVAFSVIVPAFNAARTIGQCLDSLIAAGRDDTEIIVVDDGSTDDTMKIAGEKGVTVLPRNHGGPASARNRGAEVATGEYLVFVDSDVYVHNDFIKEIDDLTQKDPSAAAIQCVYSNAIHPHNVASLYKQVFQRHLMTRAPSSEVEEIGTFATTIRRDVFSEVGGFDTAFPVASIEDIELGSRLIAAGHPIRFAQDIEVDHDCQLTTTDLVWEKFNRSRTYAEWVFRYRKKLGGARRQWAKVRKTRSYISVDYLISLLYLPAVLGAWLFWGHNRLIVALVLALVIFHANRTTRSMTAGLDLSVETKIGLIALRIMDGATVFIGVFAGFIDSILHWYKSGRKR